MAFFALERLDAVMVRSSRNDKKSGKIKENPLAEVLNFAQ